MSICDFDVRPSALPIIPRAQSIIDDWSSAYEAFTGKVAPTFRRFSSAYYGAPGAFPRKYTLKELETMTARLRRRIGSRDGHTTRAAHLEGARTG